LTRFATQSGVNLSVSPALVNGRDSAGLSGTYSVEEGFARLLQGSGLRLQPAGADAYILVPASQSSSALKLRQPPSTAGTWVTMANRMPVARSLAVARKACSVRVTSWKRRSA
jgi:iron complex outermembrane receptor protein